MIFSFDLCRARKGDCYLLHFGTRDDPGLAVVDGGPASVYAKFLRPRLLRIRQARGLDRHPLPIDLLMVSHVDDDHIRGVLDLTRELVQLHESRKPFPFTVRSFWHNSFEDLVGDLTEVRAATAGHLGAAAISGEVPDDLDIGSDDDGPSAEEVLANLKVLAGIEQGQRLRDDVKVLGIPINAEVGERLIESTKTALSVGPGLEMTVVGPLRPDLDRLREMHAKWTEDQQKKRAPADEALAAYVDRSVPNLSSIVVLARFGQKSMLLTGDARGDKILAGLEAVGAVKPGGTVKVDLLKVPHHGSANDVAPDFFRRIVADHYVFSGDGEHGNPERESVEMLLDARGAEPFTLHFTYPLADIDTNRERDWAKERAKEAKRTARTGKGTTRGKWSPKDHALRDLFAQRPLGAGQTISCIAGPCESHVIDFGTPLVEVWPALS